MMESDDSALIDISVCLGMECFVLILRACREGIVNKIKVNIRNTNRLSEATGSLGLYLRLKPGVSTRLSGLRPAKIGDEIIGCGVYGEGSRCGHSLGKL